VNAFKGEEVVFIAAGGMHGASVTKSGGLYTWGYGEFYQLGHGDKVTCILG
jgi:alpha-tubulin suppressor-like RCC1 family protein